MTGDELPMKVGQALPGVSKEVFFTRDRKVFYIVPVSTTLNSGQMEVWCSCFGWVQVDESSIEPYRTKPLRGAWQLIMNLCLALPRVVLLRFGLYKGKP